ncbi:mitochondrial outer membrane protein porin 3-like isoform X2 [Panicum virgatum]|uniref:mitochondrial outer membrane protein porin 3-like isoform X2 n=1 Tax=Panicum virgatum TaxID=38727 RepID=UPI0019D64AA4|nr:mitochondrial outer membrane protein porin 3-like isoform X2 [Panicum virgatum]
MPSASIRIRGAVTTPSAPPTARPHHAIVCSCVPSDLSWDQAIIAAGTRKNESIFGEIQTQIKKKLTMVKKKNKKLTVVFVPDQRSGKLELQYLHEFAGGNASIGHNPNPMVYFPGVFVLTANHFGSKKHSQLALMFHLILQFLLYAYEFCQEVGVPATT